MADIPTISNSAIQAVPDPQTRAVLRSIADMMAVRNGDLGNGEQAFLTMADLTANPARRKALASAVAGTISAEIPNPGGAIKDLADQLQASIIASVAWQSMFTRIGLIDAPDTQPGSPANLLLQEAKKRGADVQTVTDKVQTLTTSTASQITTLTTAIGQNAAAIQSEQSARTTADTAMATRLDVMVATVAGNTSGIQTEQSVRTNSDNALAQAINTIWSRVGTNTALVQTGTQVAVNDVGSTLSKFDQLQAVTTDPVTGLVAKSAALRQDLTLTSNTVSGMSAKWSVKLDLNGYVSGVSLNSGVSTGGAAESSFIVVADKFAIGAPGKNNIVPFAIDAKTGLVAIRGDLFVQNSITAASCAVNLITANSALIQDAAITRAKIGDAAVDTLKIAGNSVTAAASSQGYGSCSITINALGVPIWLTACGTASMGDSGTPLNVRTIVSIKRDGAQIASGANQGFQASHMGAFQVSATPVFIDYPPPGVHTYTFTVETWYATDESWQPSLGSGFINAALLETRR